METATLSKWLSESVFGSASSSLEVLLKSARAGDERAASQLFQIAYPPVRRLVERRFHVSLRSFLDAADFFDDVWRAFLARLPKYAFDSMKAFLAYLARLPSSK